MSTNHHGRSNPTLLVNGPDTSPDSIIQAKNSPFSTANVGNRHENRIHFGLVQKRQKVFENQQFQPMVKANKKNVRLHHGSTSP